jgi:hypothetical protein
MRGLVTSNWKMRSIDRRRSTLRALWIGCFNPRRRHVRRLGEHRMAAIDWHHPKWLAVAMLVLLLCCVDIVLTLTLVGAGGSEVNPVMRPLVSGNLAAFIFWKFGLTAVGVVLLILLARVRLFGALAAGPVLYLVLAGYTLLICWEAWLLARALGITEISMLLPG